MESGPQSAERPPARTCAREGAAAARWVAALVLAGCVAVYGVAAWVRPDPRGYGTHEQFGTGPCGFVVVTGYPCPTCGMTTAFAYVVRGRWGRAFLAQPAGFAFALGGLVLAVVSATTLVTGRWPRWLVRLVGSYWFFLGVLGLLLAGWAFKLLVGLAAGTFPTH